MADFSWGDKHISSHPRKETWDTLKYRSHQSPTCWINNFYWCYLQQYEWGLLTGAEIQRAETPKPTPCISGSSTGWKVSLLLPGNWSGLCCLQSVLVLPLDSSWERKLGKRKLLTWWWTESREQTREESLEKRVLFRFRFLLNHFLQGDPTS